MVEFQNVLPAHIFWSHPDTSPCARAAEVLNQSESDAEALAGLQVVIAPPLNQLP